jgi:hypothetical protein
MPAMASDQREPVQQGMADTKKKGKGGEAPVWRGSTPPPQPVTSNLWRIGSSLHRRQRLRQFLGAWTVGVGTLIVPSPTFICGLENRPSRAADTTVGRT